MGLLAGVPSTAVAGAPQHYLPPEDAARATATVCLAVRPRFRLVEPVTVYIDGIQRAEIPPRSHWCAPAVPGSYAIEIRALMTVRYDYAPSTVVTLRHTATLTVSDEEVALEVRRRRADVWLEVMDTAALSDGKTVSMRAPSWPLGVHTRDSVYDGTRDAVRAAGGDGGLPGSTWNMARMLNEARGAGAPTLADAQAVHRCIAAGSDASSMMQAAEGAGSEPTLEAALSCAAPD